MSEIDYRVLLGRYVNHVVAEEGIDFLDRGRSNPVALTTAERAAIIVAANEQYELTRE